MVTDLLANIIGRMKHPSPWDRLATYRFSAVATFGQNGEARSAARHDCDRRLFLPEVGNELVFLPLRRNSSAMNKHMPAKKSRRGCVAFRFNLSDRTKKRDRVCRSEKTLTSWACTLLAVALWGTANSAFGWIYPEHRDIALLAVQKLDPTRKEEFDQLWQDARMGYEQRLCAQGADTGQGLKPTCIDWAALSGIAGDHSCSSREMFNTVTQSKWILKVAGIAAKLKADLAKIPVTSASGYVEGQDRFIADVQRRFASEASRAARLNALRTADSNMQRADSQYATRADSNFAHFMLARPDTNLDPYAYAKLTIKPGSMRWVSMPTCTGTHC